MNPNALDYWKGMNKYVISRPENKRTTICFIAAQDAKAARTLARRIGFGKTTAQLIKTGEQIIAEYKQSL